MHRPSAPTVAHQRPKMIDFRSHPNGADDDLNFDGGSYVGYIDVSYRESDPSILEHVVEFRLNIEGVPVRLSSGQARELWAKWISYKPNRVLLVK